MRCKQSKTSGSGCTCFHRTTESEASTSGVSAVRQHEATWNQKHTDFCIKVRNGQQLKCHKSQLADKSPYFETLLEDESATDLAEILDHKSETVLHFLEYLYGEDKIKFKETFDAAKYTPDLLNMALKYRVGALQIDCMEHLKGNLTIENAVEAWKAAKKCGNVVLFSPRLTLGTDSSSQKIQFRTPSQQFRQLALELKKSALRHLMKQFTESPEGVVPGFEETFDSPEMMKDLIDFVSKNMTLKD